MQSAFVASAFISRPMGMTYKKARCQDRAKGGMNFLQPQRNLGLLRLGFPAECVQQRLGVSIGLFLAF